MKKTTINSIVILREILRRNDLTTNQEEGIRYAIEFMREAEFRHDEMVSQIGNLYIPMMGNGKYAPDGYNAAVRDVLNIVDPKKERYKKEA